MQAVTAGTEGLVISDWLNDTLTADAALIAAMGGGDAIDRIGEGLVPAGAGGWPVVTWTVIEPQQINGVGLTEIMARVSFTIKAVTQSRSYAPIVPVVQRIHALIASKANVTVSQGLVLTCERRAGIQYPERTEGIEYRHLGGLYEAHVQ